MEAVDRLEELLVRRVGPLLQVRTKLAERQVLAGRQGQGEIQRPLVEPRRMEEAPRTAEAQEDLVQYRVGHAIRTCSKSMT